MKKAQKNKVDNSKYIGNYQIIKKIGEGSYAKIYKAKKDNSDILYVLKNIPVSEEDYSSMNEILNESSILSNCDNVYIIKYYDSFFYNGTFNIITEFCPYGDLFGYIKFYKVRGSRIEEKIIWIIFIQLSLGLGYLHSKKILHRDIKTKNIFIKNNLTVKIGDFGIAKILSSTSSYAHTFIGTPYYISPELCKDQPYNDKSDVWALGCVLYELCTLNHPFEGGTQVEIYEKIITQKFKSINPEYSSDLKKMIDLLLEKDEKKRPKMKDILKMKSVIDRANKYNIELDIYDTIDEEEKIVNVNSKIKNKNEINESDNKNSINKNNYNSYNNKYNNNNKEILRSSGKKEINEKSPDNCKSKKTKLDFDNKTNRIKIDSVIKNQIKQKSQKKSSINKISSILSTKNKSVSSTNQEEDSSFNMVGSQQQQSSINNNISNNINNNNQPPQYVKQFREIINIDKLNNNNKIKFTSPIELNNKNRIKDSYNSKGKIKSIQTGNLLQQAKLINKMEKEKSDLYSQKDITQESTSYNISNKTKSNDFNNILITKNSNNNHNISNNENNSAVNNQNYYYYKKEAILKKQQQQRNILNKKEILNNDMNKKNLIKGYYYISKSKTSSEIKGNKSQNINTSDDRETIKENENYLSDENSNEANNNNNNEDNNNINNNEKQKQKETSNKIIIPSPLKSGNQSTKNIKEFTLEKLPTQKLNNSFTIDQTKENVKMFIESNNYLNEKPNSEVILENIKLQKLKDDTIKKIKKNENEMKSISYGVYQHIINMYKGIEADNKDITALTDSIQKYMRQNLFIKDDQESEKLYKTFKKSFFNYIVCEIELNNIDKQIEKRKIGGKWDLNQTQNDNNIINNKLKINTIQDDFDKIYGKPKNIYKNNTKQ